MTILFICSTLLSFTQGNEKLTVYFRFNDYKLNDISRSKTDSLLHTSAFVAYRIDAHCDSVENHAYNDNLSMQRALSVKEYLTKNNINDSLISIKPMGKIWQAAIVFSARRLILPTWLNDRDQFLQPTEPLAYEFKNDCLVWFGCFLMAAI